MPGYDVCGWISDRPLAFDFVLPQTTRNSVKCGMPLYPHAVELIRDNLRKVSLGERPHLISIGELTAIQFNAINIWRTANQFPPLGSSEVVYLGRHHHASRTKDGYSIEDMILQLHHGMDTNAIVKMTMRMTRLESVTSRADGYGNNVLDAVILELTSRKPRAEAFSAIPYGDIVKPEK